MLWRLRVRDGSARRGEGFTSVSPSHTHPLRALRVQGSPLPAKTRESSPSSEDDIDKLLESLQPKGREGGAGTRGAQPSGADCRRGPHAPRLPAACCLAAQEAHRIPATSASNTRRADAARGARSHDGVPLPSGAAVKKGDDTKKPSGKKEAAAAADGEIPVILSGKLTRNKARRHSLAGTCSPRAFGRTRRSRLPQPTRASPPGPQVIVQCEGHDDTVDFEGDFGAVGRFYSSRSVLPLAGAPSPLAAASAGMPQRHFAAGRFS